MIGMTAKFHGIIPAVLTPLDQSDKVDIEALKQLVGYLKDARVHGLQPLGSTGQGPLLTKEERKLVAKTVIDAASSSIPVMIHVGDATTSVTLELAKHAKDVGADAVACVTPYYYSYDEGALLNHYSALSQSIDLPIFVYNIPRYTGFNVSVPFLKKLVKIPGIVGIKDSSRDLSQMLDIIAELREGFTLLSGPDKLIFQALISGAPGAISALANVFPDVCVGIYDSVKRGDFAKGRELQERLNAARPYLETPVLAPLFEALRLMGLKSGNARLPLRPLTHEEKRKLEEGLRSLQLLKPIARM
jgi:4-hydroxy-tetrahydrodipicolinate synthase